MRRRLRFVAGLVPALIVTLCAARAHADETIGVLHVEVVGASKTAAEMFETSLEDGLGNAGFKVATRVKMRELLEPSGFQAGCLFGPCLKLVYGVTGVRLVLVARITGVGKNFTYLVTLLDTRTGTVAAQATDDCPVCTVDEAVATASMAVIGLVTGASDPGMVDPTDPGRALDLNALREAQRAAEDTLAARKNSLGRGAVFLLSMAAIAGAVSATAFLKDEHEAGYLAAGVGGAFVISGGTLLIISRKF